MVARRPAGAGGAGKPHGVQEMPGAKHLPGAQAASGPSALDAPQSAPAASIGAVARGVKAAGTKTAASALAKGIEKAPAPCATQNARAFASAKPATKRKPVSIATRRKRFLARLSETANVSRSARDAGMSSSALYRHRALHAGFAKQWDDAIDAAMDELEDALIHRAKHGVERPVYFGGKQVGTVRNYSDALGMFLLKAKRPEVYNRLKAPMDGAETVADLSADDARAEVMRRLELLDEPEGDDAP
ncbi:MAG: hypothetical protein WC803_11810 [Sphingomonas sp.]